MDISSAGYLHQLFVVANPSSEWSKHHSQDAILTHLYGFLKIFGDFVHPATTDRQLWTISTNLFSKGCIDKNSRRRFVT
jgi:hypothetical protein